MRDIFLHIVRWFVANALLPMAVPVVFLAALVWLNNGTFPLAETFVGLLKGGFYIFSASALTFSLFEDYSLFKRNVGPVSVILLLILLSMTLGMFYTQMRDAKYVEGHSVQFVAIWGISAIVSAWVKWRMLNDQQRNGL